MKPSGTVARTCIAVDYTRPGSWEFEAKRGDTKPQLLLNPSGAEDPTGPLT